MRKRFRVEVEYLIDVEDDKDLHQYTDLADYLGRNNMTAENEFFDNCTQLCAECGIPLSHDEEKEDGLCMQCAGPGDK